MSSNSSRKSKSGKAAEPSKSSGPPKPTRPKKPYSDYPLTPHATGKWQKKIRGDIYYFGRWAKQVNGKLEPVPGDGWKEALELYKAQADDLHAGRTPRPKSDQLTIKGLGDRFLTAKLRAVAAGELGKRTYEEYRQATQLLADTFGRDRLVEDLAADDFAKLRAVMAERWGVTRLGKMITCLKSVFKFGLDNGILERLPRYGSEFKKPSKSVVRRHRAANGNRMLEAGELRRILDSADPMLRAMVLLGLNCGFGNHDVGSLPLSALDLDKGWVSFPRPKTGIDRRCPLWPETVEALKTVIAQRPTPSTEGDKATVFLNRTRCSFVRETDKGRTDGIGPWFSERLEELGLYREGLGFYSLPHIFRTVADGAKDTVAIDLIMGHTDSSMASHYREAIDDSRLLAVSDYVRGWLFSDSKRPETESPPKTYTPDSCGPCAPKPPNPIKHAKSEGRKGSQGSQDSETPVPPLRLFAG
jgi:integrase